ncbi:MAG: OsmC family protein, partial [Pseudomonadota bacterium]
MAPLADYLAGMAKSHTYTTTVTWTGNRGEGTAHYRAYGRDHVFAAGAKPEIPGSADAALLGNADRWNPEDSLINAISACHMLWFLHLASDAGWIVETYSDQAEGVMEMNPYGSGQFTETVLHPKVEISTGDPALSDELHHRAHDMCFIA